MSKYWTDVFQNAIGCAIGSAVAIAISILIYWLSIRQSNIKLAQEKRATELDQLKAFKIMLQRAIKVSEILLEGIKNYIPEIKKHTTEFPLLTITSFGNFKRIIDTITFEKTGITYIKHFPGEKSTDEFISILEGIDYLYAEFSELQMVLERASKSHTERLNRISNIFDVADKLAIDYIGILPNRNNITKIITKIKFDFINKRGDPSNIDTIYQLYFLPMKELMGNIINDGFMDDFVRNFAYSIAKGIEYYNYVGTGYDRFALEVVTIENTLKTNFAKFKASTEKILQSDIN